jgi:p-aminobenzoyl-glutamate transporter AbgT
VHSITAFELARLLIIVAGAAALAVSTIFSRPWLFAAWVKPAFWLLGLACVVWAALRLVLVFHGNSLSRQMYRFLDSQRPFMLGIAFAMLVLFFVSGEARRGVARWRELKKQRS